MGKKDERLLFLLTMYKHPSAWDNLAFWAGVYSDWHRADMERAAKADSQEEAESIVMAARPGWRDCIEAREVAEMSHLLLCHHADVGDIPGYDHPDRYTVTERAEQAAVIRAKLAAKFTDQCVDNEAPDGEGDDEEGTLPETPIEGTGNEFVTLNDLAERFEVDKEATRKRLERWRKPAGNPKDWMLHPDPTRTTGDYLYRVNAVRSICEKSASG